MLVVGFDRLTINKAIELADTYPFIYASIGFHPVDAIDFTDDDFLWLETLTKHEKVVALGEMGLDYHWDKSPKEVQKKVFRKQIALAKKVKLPIIIHNREATDDVISILQEEQAQVVGGVMHCFAGEVKHIQPCLDLNFYLSLGGPVTFKNAKEAKAVAQAIPSDRLLIETDCPFLAPHPYRGKRNEPMYVLCVALVIAELRNTTLEVIAEETMRNANTLFKLP